MANLVPYDVKNITANYSNKDKQFAVTATAPLPVPFRTAEFTKANSPNGDPILGGRLLRLEGFTSGIPGAQAAGPPKQYTESMAQPPRFQAISIVLKDPSTKAETTVNVKVTLDAAASTPATNPAPVPVPTAATAPATQLIPLQPQPIPAVKSIAPTLSRIDIELPLRSVVRITAPIPVDASGSRTTTEGRHESDATSTWRAGQLPGFVYWDVVWAGNNGPGSQVGVPFTVTTTVTKGMSNGTSNATVAGQTSGAASQVAVQSYFIRLPVERRPLEDLFDPNA